MNHLLRSHAPISDAGWEMLDEEARTRLTSALAARKLIDFSGPHGWDYSARSLGRVSPLKATLCEGVSGLQRRVLPLVELRADFELSRAELRDGDRGADDTDLAGLDQAAHQIATAGAARSSVSARPLRTSSPSSAAPSTVIRGWWRAQWSGFCVVA